MSSAQWRGLLLGRDPSRTRRTLVVGGLAVGAPFAYYIVARAAARNGLWLYPNPFLAVGVLTLLAFVVPAWNAYRNDGLLVSVLLGAIMLGATAFVVTYFKLFSMLPTPVEGTLTASGFGAVAGTVGFVAGAIAARIEFQGLEPGT